MTARELIQKIIEECPDIDAEIYIQKPLDEIEMKDYEIEKITNGGSNDAIFIEIKDWQPITRG